MSDASLPKLRKPLPGGRSHERLARHYLVEKALADRLKAADRDSRKEIYATMYTELFAAIPDHPRLVAARADPKDNERRNRNKLRLVSEYLTPSTVAVEFAPGDCSFSRFLSSQVKQVYSIDISDQDPFSDPRPDNYRALTYNGYSLPCLHEKPDLVFSDQFIEHLHPEDVGHHFCLVRSLLKAGGWYVLRTPHAAHGPFDVSAYFSDVPQGFHLKEWTYSELGSVLQKSGFSRWAGKRRAKGVFRALPCSYWKGAEAVIGACSGRLRTVAARILVPRHLVIAARVE